MVLSVLVFSVFWLKTCVVTIDVLSIDIMQADDKLCGALRIIWWTLNVNSFAGSRSDVMD